MSWPREEKWKKYLEVYNFRINISLIILFFIYFDIYSQINTSNIYLNNPIKSNISDTIFKKNAPSRITRKIRKDKSGNLLIAAFDNIYIYSGNSFSIVPELTSINELAAFDVLQDSKGIIWIASTKNGLFKLENGLLTHITIDNGLKSNRLMDLFEASDGRIWISTMSGINYYKDGQMKSLEINNKDYDTNTIFEDKNGNILIASREGFYIVNDNDNSISEFKNTNGNTFNNVWSIIRDHKNNIWFGSECGLWKYNSSIFNKVSDDFVNGILEDSNNNIWFTTQSGSLNKIGNRNSNQNKVIKIFDHHKMLFGINEDKSGNLWIGTLDGLLRFDGFTKSCIREVNKF